MATRTMASTTTPSVTRWIAAVAVLFLLVHLLVGLPVLLVQSQLPDADRALLESFAIYGVGSWVDVVGQLARGAVVALILYPFHGAVLRSARPALVLFGFFWGLSMVGAVEPLPGSIEGLIYTHTSAAGHALILVATAVQAGILALSIPRIDAWLGSSVRVAHGPASGGAARTRGTIARFVIVHVVTYVAAGLAFMWLQDYRDAFATLPQFAAYRSLDDPLIALGIPLQIPRGVVLATCMMPFVRAVLGRAGGSFAVFAVLFGATALASAAFLPTLLGAVTTEFSLATFLIGLSEIVVQMALFAWLFMVWERRRSLPGGRRG